MPATKVEKKSMKMTEIKDKAQALGILPGKMKKVELVRAIQMAEGFTACFGWSNSQCENIDCCFMQDCLKIRL